MHDARFKHVKTAVHLAQITATENKNCAPPDDDIVRQIIEASGYDTAENIERVLRATAKQQAPREIEKYAYWIPVIKAARERGAL